MVKLSHYAFLEGQRGYRNGCGSDMNPYHNSEGSVDAKDKEAFSQWKIGWRSEEWKAKDFDPSIAPKFCGEFPIAE
jgi:hypothetical protein